MEINLSIAMPSTELQTNVAVAAALADVAEQVRHHLVVNGPPEVDGEQIQFTAFAYEGADPVLAILYRSA